MKKLVGISETSYLNAINAEQYRRIMRIFFDEYEKMHYQLYQEDIYEKIITYPEFSDYAVDQLKHDLESLVNWKNLVAIQDPKRVYTIADYKNKQFRYSMSDNAVEIERLTVKLENLFIEGGSLSTNLFAKINYNIDRFNDVQALPLNKINEWWRDLQDDFIKLNQNYKDYLREFYSGKADKVLKSVDFILHKDRLISYLREFIKELQSNSSRIEKSLYKISPETEKAVLEAVIRSEIDVPYPIPGSDEDKKDYEKRVEASVYGRWESLKNWFIARENQPAESSRVLDITDDIIRKIIQNASLIVQLQNWGVSRKDDYKKFISMFLDCEDIGEAHKLSAHIFGVQKIQHFKVNMPRETDSINSSTFDEIPMEFSIKPRIRTYKPKIDKSGFENKTMEKLAQRKSYLEQVEIDKKIVLKYIKDDILDISSIDEVLSESTRITLLRWISNANLNESKVGTTEFGGEFTLVKGSEYCTLKCVDGDLHMPSYILEFK